MLSTCPSVSSESAASAPPALYDWPLDQPIRCVIPQEAEVNREWTCFFYQRGRRRERGRLAWDQGHGHCISMETPRWLTEVSGGKGGGVFGCVTRTSPGVPSSFLYVKNAKTTRHSIYEVALIRFKADFSRREPSESGDATGTASWPLAKDGNRQRGERGEWPAYIQPNIIC